MCSLPEDGDVEDEAGGMARRSFCAPEADLLPEGKSPEVGLDHETA